MTIGGGAGRPGPEGWWEVSEVWAQGWMLESLSHQTVLLDVLCSGQLWSPLSLQGSCMFVPSSFLARGPVGGMVGETALAVSRVAAPHGHGHLTLSRHLKLLFCLRLAFPFSLTVCFSRELGRLEMDGWGSSS